MATRFLNQLGLSIPDPRQQLLLKRTLKKRHGSPALFIKLLPQSCQYLLVLRLRSCLQRACIAWTRLDIYPGLQDRCAASSSKLGLGTLGLARSAQDLLLLELNLKALDRSFNAWPLCLDAPIHSDCSRKLGRLALSSWLDVLFTLAICGGPFLGLALRARISALATTSLAHQGVCRTYNLPELGKVYSITSLSAHLIGVWPLLDLRLRSRSGLGVLGWGFKFQGGLPSPKITQNTTRVGSMFPGRLC